MKLNRLDVELSGNRCSPTVTVRVDDHPVEITARVNGKLIDESRLLDMVHAAGMIHAANMIEEMPDDESAAAFLKGLMEA